MAQTSELIERIGNLVRAERRQLSGLPEVQTQLLSYFESANRYSNTLTAAAAFLGSSKASVSSSIESLIEKGHLKRVKNLTDARQSHLLLSRKGKDLLERIQNGTLAAAINKASVSSPELNLDLQTLLRQLQQQSGSRPFGQCRSCRFFELLSGNSHYRCGLTKETLTEQDSMKNCIECEPASL